MNRPSRSRPDALGAMRLEDFKAHLRTIAHELRLHPFWDPLHSDPRLEKLVEESKELIVLK